MKRIGITGGIGSGKSVVASLFELYHIPVYIADVESKKLTATSPIIREQLIHLLGPDVYTAEGLNRMFLASCIFSDADILKQVNGIIHPEVKHHFLAWCEKQKQPIVAMESAILFESGFDTSVDIKLMVYAPVEIRIRRAMLREKVSRDEIERRINHQMADEIKKEKSDYVIYNDDRHALIPQVAAFLENIKSKI